MKQMKYFALIALTTISTVWARSYDLRESNLVDRIEKMVQEATQNGTYNALPACIKKADAGIKKNNYTVDSFEIVQEIAVALEEPSIKRSNLDKKQIRK